MLIGFASVISIMFWQFQAMPAPDLVSFLQVGRQLWSGQVPSDFMRAPVYGLIVYPLGLAIGSAWIAALLINAILYPLNVGLVYLITRRYLPRAAFFIAIIFAINPWVIEMLTRTLCETTLIFLCLLTIWLLGIGSRWAYLAGSIAVVTRYDSIGVLVAVIINGLLNKRYRQTIILGLLSLIPLGLWMLGTWLSLRQGDHVHYVQLLSLKGLTSVVGWRTLMRATLWPIPANSLAIIPLLALIGFAGWTSRQAWPLWLFASLYGVLHLLYQFQEPRMYVPIVWVVLAMAAIGIAGLASRWPRATFCIAGLLVGISFALQTPSTLQYGLRDAEFRQLIDWRKANIPAGHRILTSMAELMRIADPEGGDSYISLRQITGQIDQYCQQHAIDYLVCDSRLLAASDASVWYSQDLLSVWRRLAEGKDVKGWNLLTTIVNPLDSRYYLRVYQRR